MADIHIADFYKDAARILVQLYNQFPRPAMLFVEDIAGPDTPDEFGLHSPRHEACLATMMWLSRNGYLSYESLIRQEAIDQAVLTQQGFTLLASPVPVQEVVGMGEAAPDSEEEEAGEESDLPEPEPEPMPPTEPDNGVQLLREVLRHGSSTAIEQVMLELLRQARHHR